MPKVPDDPMFYVAVVNVFVSACAFAALVYSSWQTRRSSRAAEDAVRVARSASEAQSRAWISINCVLGPPRRGRTQEQTDGIYFTVVCRARNHGGSPATSITFHAEVGLIGPGHLQPEEIMCEYCDKMRDRPKHEGEAVFPNSEDEFGHEVFISDAAIKEDMVDKQFKMIAPIVYGCLNYRSPYIDGVRQTRFLYYIGTFNEDGVLVVLQPNNSDWLERKIMFTRPATIICD